MPKTKVTIPNLDVAPPTMIRTRLSDGRLLGVDNSLWLVRKLPLEPVADAKSVEERMNAFTPLMAAYEELSALTQVGVNKRALARSRYRQMKLLMVNLNRLFTPPANHPIAGYLKQSFPNQVTEKHLLLLAVKLDARLGTGGGLRAAVDSVTETLLYGGTPLSDFDADLKKVDAALARCGLSTPTGEELAVANSWWNQGRFPDTVHLAHSEHLHVFSDDKAVRMARTAGPDDCDKWPVIPGARSLTFASLESFDFDFQDPTQTAANWATGLIEDGAVAISVNALIEPARVTRAELRRQRKRYLDDINERAKQGKMERAEQEEMVETLERVEAVYASGDGSSTLVDASVLVAFDGEVEDIETVGRGSAANLRIMNHRQLQALSEMMLCSRIRANPNLHDMPTQTIACAGLQSLAVVGDPTGALIGFTERDRQPAYVSPTAASTADGLPLMLVVGGTGSGKTQALLWSAVQMTGMAGPVSPRTPVVIVDPKALALDTRIPTPEGWTTMGEVEVGDQVIGRDGNACKVTHKSRIFTPDETRMYEFVLDDGQIIRADQNHQWVVATTNDRRALERGEGRDATELDRLARTVEQLAAGAGDGQMLPTRRLLSMLGSAGVDRWGNDPQVTEVLSRAGVISDVSGKRQLWPAGVAFKALAAHLREEQSLGTDRLRVLKTDEILSHGLKTLRGGGQTYYSIPLPAAIERPEADLGVPPYILGAWLGDGTTKSGAICSGHSDAMEMEALLQAEWPRPLKASHGGSTMIFSFPRDPAQCKRGHRDFVPTVKGSIRCRSCGTGKAVGEVINGSLGDLLSDIGVLGAKRIPVAYLRASIEQRLALLQGIMDTDGTVHVKRRELRLTLANEALTSDVIELVRSLGIKAHLHRSRGILVSRDAAGKPVRTDYGTVCTVTFQTGLPVFRLKRKLAIQPEPKFRSQHLYIKDIRPIEAAPAQCIRVDSPDHTYLVEGYVPTHNTGSDHSPTVLAAGGQVISLDEVSKSDGVFDPIRFATTPEVGVELAASMLGAIDPWGGRGAEYEVAVYTALQFGVSRGARCIGQALTIAYREGKASREMIEPIFNLAQASPMFRACVGMNPESQPLNIFDGITLIKVGDSHLELPEPGAVKTATLMQRVCLALVRMMVFGSAMALTGRGGVIKLDEAWVFLGAGKAEVERLGRLARSQGVLPVLYTQRVSDALNAELAGYISRGLILPIEDRKEARASLELFKLEPTPERMERITAKATVGEGESVAPNWMSMKALRDPVTKEVLRGSVGIYADLAGRAVPVEIVLPATFLRMASTNPEDIARRDAEAEQRALVGAAAG